MWISPRASSFGHSRSSCLPFPGGVSSGLTLPMRALRTRGPKCTSSLRPVAASQRRIRWSCPAVTRVRPFDVQRTVVTGPPCATWLWFNTGPGRAPEPVMGSAPMTPMLSSRSREARAGEARRMSKIRTRPWVSPEARMCGWIGEKERV